jgi:hypothetical protein
LINSLYQIEGVFYADYLARDQKEASSEPVKLCHKENRAPGKAATGAKYLTAKATAKPEFCIPTSIDRVLHVR